MSQLPFILCTENYTEPETKATYFKNDGSVHSHLVASTAQGIDSFIIDMFECIQKRAIYDWDVHVECIDTPVDWQMTIDTRHVFHSTDFLPGMGLAGQKLSDYATMFETATMIEFKPRVLVESEAHMQEMGLSNYREYMNYILYSQPQLRQRRAMKNEELNRHRQHLQAAMLQFMKPLHDARERYMNRPQTISERYLPIEDHMSTFDQAGEIVTFVKDMHKLSAGSVYILFVQCEMFAKMKNCHISTQNCDWEVVINGRYRMREIDFRRPEPGQLPIIFDDYPDVFTRPVTITKQPRFLARNARAMAAFQCTNYHIFRLYLNNVEKMKEFIFFEYNGGTQIRDVHPQIFDALVSSLRK